jgi:hypothetical protein
VTSRYIADPDWIRLERFDGQLSYSLSGVASMGLPVSLHQALHLFSKISHVFGPTPVKQIRSLGRSYVTGQAASDLHALPYDSADFKPLAWASSRSSGVSGRLSLSMCSLSSPERNHSLASLHLRDHERW